MNYKKSNGIYVFAMLGGLVATICDGIHVHTRTLAYAKPFLFRQAWWVFPLFVLTFLFMGFAYLFLCDHLTSNIPCQKSSSKGNSREFVEAVTAFVLVYMLSGFGNFEPILLSVIFYGIFAVRCFFSYDRSWLLILSISMAIGGMFAEGVISSAGMMIYRHVDVFYVPLWLGGLYMHGAFALREGMRYFIYESKEDL